MSTLMLHWMFLVDIKTQVDTLDVYYNPSIKIWARHLQCVFFISKDALRHPITSR